MTRKGLYESATVRCHGCHAQIVLRPERSRERAWCWRHDSYLCDRCAVIAKIHGCKPLDKLFDELQRKAEVEKVLF